MQGLTKKRYAGAVCALLLFLLLCAAIAVPVRALDKVDPNEDIAVTAGTPPTLTVSCGETSVSAKSNSYESSGTIVRAIADRAHPLHKGGEKIALPVLYRDEGTRFLRLAFSKPPRSVTAKRCLSSDRGKDKPEFAESAYRVGVLTMSDTRGDSCYEIHADWESGEHCFYFFEVKAAAPADIAFQTAEALHGSRDPKVNILITNNSKIDIGYGLDVSLERLTTGKWQRISRNREIPSIARMVFPGATQADQIKLTDDLTLPAPNGFYRIGKYLREGDKLAYAEFEIGPRPDDFVFGLPTSMTASYRDKSGKEISVPLERTGKFRGSSPFVYVSDRLSKLLGTSLCDTPATSPPDELTLNVHYPDGGIVGTKIVLYSDGRMQTSTGFYNTGDTSTYNDVKACVASLTVG